MVQTLSYIWPLESSHTSVNNSLEQPTLSHPSTSINPFFHNENFPIAIMMYFRKNFQSHQPWTEYWPFEHTIYPRTRCRPLWAQSLDPWNLLIQLAHLPSEERFWNFQVLGNEVFGNFRLKKLRNFWTTENTIFTFTYQLNHQNESRAIIFPSSPRPNQHHHRRRPRLLRSQCPKLMPNPKIRKHHQFRVPRLLRSQCPPLIRNPPIKNNHQFLAAWAPKHRNHFLQIQTARKPRTSSSRLKHLQNQSQKENCYTAKLWTKPAAQWLRSMISVKAGSISSKSLAICSTQ